MQKYTEMIIDMVKKEKLFADQGGPIIMAQIENEYNNVQLAYREAGEKYIEWAADMAVATYNAIPWVMCKQKDAPDRVVRYFFPSILLSLIRYSVMSNTINFQSRLVRAMGDSVEILSLVQMALTSLHCGPRTGLLSKYKTYASIMPYWHNDFVLTGDFALEHKIWL